MRHVLDTGSSVSLALVESCREFVERLEKNNSAARWPWVAPPASRAISSTRTELVRDFDAEGPQGVAAAAAFAALADTPPPLPLLCSACPGWVCYAEKTAPEAIPFMSAIKSPQQILGALVKCFLGATAVAANLPTDAPFVPEAVSPAAASRIYHTTVMPCYDKKLEASRLDFFWEGPPTPDSEGGGAGVASGTGVRGAGGREVDCVLTAGEVVEMIREDVGHLASVSETPRRGPVLGDASTVDIDTLFCSLDVSGTRFVGPCASGGESDAFVETLARYCALKLGGEALPEGPLPFVAGRNPDFRELTVRINQSPSGRELRFALAYGFRNIQTVLNRIKRGSKASGASLNLWDYVEVMACPSGCVNGGGQNRPSAAETGGTIGTAAALASRVSALMHDRDVSRPWDSPAVAAIEGALSALRLTPSQLALLTRTQYHHVPKLETTLIRW